MPKVSVIVPNFNHEKYLKQRLDSIINQNYKDFELIILDDSSTDQSVNLISRYARKYPDIIQFVPSLKNSGSPFLQWDKGINLSNGEYLWIAESDDLASINFLENIVPFLNKYPEVSIVSCKSNAIDSAGKEISKIHPMYQGYENQLFSNSDESFKYFSGQDFIKNYLVHKCLIPNVSGILMRKSNYITSGGLNLTYKLNGDYDLYFRLLWTSDIIFLNKTLNSTRYHDDKLTANNSPESFKELTSILSPIFERLKLSTKKRLEIMSFYFTVYKYDIFLNKNYSMLNKLRIFRYLSNLSGLLYLRFGRFLMQRLKIRLSKSRVNLNY